MPNESDSGHDASARTDNARAPHTPADADIFDQAGDELERRVAAAVPPQFQRGQGNGGDRGGEGGDGGQVRERRPLRADLGEEPPRAGDWIESFRDVHFSWNERGPAGESERSPGDDWWRSLGELDTEIDAEPTRDATAGSPEVGEWWRSLGESDTEIDAEPTRDATAGSPEVGEWWRTPDEQLAFAPNSPPLPAESDGLTRAAEPAGDVGAAGSNGAERGRRGALVLAERGRRGALVLAERGRRGALVLAGFAALAILVAGTVGVVVVSRSDGSRPAGKIVSDRTTAPTTTTTPLPTTIPPVPETSAPAPSVPPAPPQTTARAPTTSRRTVPPPDEGAVEPPPPPAPPPPPPPPATTSPPPTQPPPLPSLPPLP